MAKKSPFWGMTLPTNMPKVMPPKKHMMKGLDKGKETVEEETKELAAAKKKQKKK